MPNPGIQALLEKIARFRSELEKPFVGRSEEATVLTLALITGEHVLLMGSLAPRNPLSLGERQS